MDALKRDLFALANREFRNRSTTLICFFGGVAVSLFYDVILLIFRLSPTFIVIINVVLAFVIATSLNMPAFVTVCRQGASALGTKVLDILKRHATDASLANRSKPVAALIRIAISHWMTPKADEPTPCPTTDVHEEDFSQCGTYVAGFVAGRLVHLIVQFIGFIVQTRIVLFVFSCLQSLYLIHMMYFVCIALLSSIATTVFVIVY